MNANLNKLTSGLAIAGLSVAAISYAAMTKSPSTVQATASKPETLASAAPPDPNAVVTLVAVGDVMIGSAFPNKGFLPNDDAKHSFDAVLPFLKGDVVFGNLEGSLIDNGISTKCPSVSDTATDKPVANTAKTQATNQATIANNNNLPSAQTGVSQAVKPARTCYAFGMPTRYAHVIKNAGFNLVSIANNHVGDFGEAGRASTLDALQKADIHHAGLLSKPTTTFEQNGIKYGFVAFAPNVGTVSINDIPNAKKLVKDLDKKVDIVIVSMHGGAEGADNTHVPKTDEIYLNEKRGNVHAFAHAVIDSGADVVLGSGPHVTRALEVYRNKLIAYSLGNFNTYGAFNLKGAAGVSPILSLSLAKNGDFVFADVTSTKQTKEHRLQLDKTNQAFKELKALTASDFPDTPLEFNDNMVTLKSSQSTPINLASSAKNW